MAIVGTAAWSIGREVADQFPSEGSSLARYAAILNGVEINSSFYKTHKPDTWRRWADSVPESFRFSVKLPKRISHELRLVEAEGVFDVAGVFAGMIVLSAFVILIDFAVTLVERRLLGWKPVAAGRD